MDAIHQAFLNGMKRACAERGVDIGDVLKAAADSPAVVLPARKRSIKAEDLLGRDGGAFAGDVFSPWAAHRAGRAEAMAESSGTPTDDVPFNVKHPAVQTAGWQLGGGIAGGLLGGLAGGGGATLAGAPPIDVGRAGGIGAGVGGVLGLLAGALVAARNRRVSMHRISEQFDAADEVAPTYQTASPWSWLSLGSGTAPHALGRAQAARAMVDGHYDSGPINAFGAGEMAAARVIPRLGAKGVMSPGATAGALTGLTAASLGGQGFMANRMKERLLDEPGAQLKQSAYLAGIKQACIDAGAPAELTAALLKAAQAPVTTDVTAGL